jgi:hypothetical protein
LSIVVPGREILSLTFRDEHKSEDVPEQEAEQNVYLKEAE